MMDYDILSFHIIGHIQQITFMYAIFFSFFTYRSALSFTNSFTYSFISSFTYSYNNSFSNLNHCLFTYWSTNLCYKSCTNTITYYLSMNLTIHLLIYLSNINVSTIYQFIYLLCQLVRLLHHHESFLLLCFSC